MDIRILDKNQDWETWIVEEVCGIDLDDYNFERAFLTQKNLEMYLDEIIERVEDMKDRVDNPPIYGEQILDLKDAIIAYQIFALLILETGSYLPEHIREEVLKTTTWEFDKRWELDPNALNIRRFYLNEFRDKILSHMPGHRHKFVDLKIHSDGEFKRTSVGLEQLNKLIKTRKINKINYINLDCCELESVPEEILNLDHIEKLSIEKNNLICSKLQ